MSVKDVGRSGKSKRGGESGANLRAPAGESINADGWFNKAEDRFGEPVVSAAVGIDVEQIDFVVLPGADVYHAIEAVALVDRDAVLLFAAAVNSDGPRKEIVVIAGLGTARTQAARSSLRASDVTPASGLLLTSKLPTLLWLELSTHTPNLPLPEITGI